jgi:hypothetical protein
MDDADDGSVPPRQWRATLVPQRRLRAKLVVLLLKRAQWLNARLYERGWSVYDLCRHVGGEEKSLDPKTVRKILDGKPVQPRSLRQVALGLSAYRDEDGKRKFAKVELSHIPPR